MAGRVSCFVYEKGYVNDVSIYIAVLIMMS
jgi:hypothetical protein